MAPLNRRELLGAAALSWLTPLGRLLARDAEHRRGPARSVIVLWLEGGPSQLETFDPKPDTRIAAGTRAIATAAPGVRLAAGFGHLAEEMADVALVRSLVSPEGDHERGAYLLKTGYRPEPTVVHPSLGAIVCHALPGRELDIPRHVSILPGQWPARGGFLGAEFDAFKMADPADPVPDVAARVADDRFDKRMSDLAVVESAFAARRGDRATASGHMATVERAQRMMTAEQLRAFDISAEPKAVRAEYGDTPFGRGCLAARRLLEVGVRCVEVTLPGWDSHANNHAVHDRLVKVLDPAFAALIRDLRRRHLLEQTIVLCVGEFGRTPKVNALGGRDHWPHNFSAALAGGRIAGGVVVGESDPDGGREPRDPVPAVNLHATVLTALGVEPEKLLRTPLRRTVKRSEGEPIRAILNP